MLLLFNPVRCPLTLQLEEKSLGINIPLGLGVSLSTTFFVLLLPLQNKYIETQQNTFYCLHHFIHLEPVSTTHSVHINQQQLIQTHWQREREWVVEAVLVPLLYCSCFIHIFTSVIKQLPGREEMFLRSGRSRKNLILRVDLHEAYEWSVIQLGTVVQGTATFINTHFAITLFALV